MSKKLNKYEQILEIAKIAEQLDFKYRDEIEKDTDHIKKIINKPQQTRKIPYEAYQIYFNLNEDVKIKD